MARILKLPVGISSFSVMRENGFLYVDKTEAIYRLVDEGRYYFIARPRRFGKSLLVSTLRCLFEGRQELFTGLWLGEHAEWTWDVHPVVMLDFNGISLSTPEILQQGLRSRLEGIAQTHHITLHNTLLKEAFRELILALQRRTGQAVVVLVDEYDKPLIEHLGRGAAALEYARANRAILKAFFGVLKDNDVMAVLRLVLFTGISRFSKVSIFSELNHLEDLTLSPHYAALLGYTQAELVRDFQPYLAQFAEAQHSSVADIVQRLQGRYDGYRFSVAPTRVYNPFSTLRALREQRFGDYWFETGTPTFLINLLKERQYPLPQIERFETDTAIFSTYDVDALQPEALLFQTGYATILDEQHGMYTLGYPNQEVKHAFVKYLFYTEAPANATRMYMLRLAGYLRRGEFDAFFGAIQAIFASIPYTLNAKRDEAYFHTLFYLMVSASGVDARSELLTSRGRIDLVVEFPAVVYILEFKCGQSPQVALQQIHTQGYAERYQHSDRQLWAIGLEFNAEERNLVAWQVEKLA